MPTFMVPTMVSVEAKSKKDAADEVSGLLEYAFEVSNDEGRFKRYVVADKSEIQKDAS